MNHSFILKLLTTAALLLSSMGAVVGQQSFGGVPAGFTASPSELRSTMAAPLVRVLPEFNVRDFQTTRQWNKGEVHFKPLTVGRILETSIDFSRDARAIELEYGKIIYRLRISSPGAQAMTLLYDDFFIPNDGGRLFIYNTKRTTLLGAYTHETHPEHGAFSNEPLSGDEVIMEYEPGYTGALPSLQVSGIGYIYGAKLDEGSGQLRSIFYPGEDESGDPIRQININCPEGAEWQTEKAGVCQLIMYDTTLGGVGLCSGDLMNNTNEDFTPLILSAAHCISMTRELTIKQKDLDRWTFVFHYEKQGCSNGSLALNRGKSVVGCTVKTFLPFDGQSDGLLLQAHNKVPENYRVYYNGWDRYSILPKTPLVGIHHPSGDAKKISLSDGPVWLGTWAAGEKDAGATNAHLLFVYDKGTTEGGSSGSSLFSAEHLVVGTLTGGRPNGEDYYGRLRFHWDEFRDSSNPQSSMDIYLDPKTDGMARKLKGTWRNGMKPLQTVSDFKVSVNDKEAHLSWTAIDKETIPSEWRISYRIYRNGEYITEVTGSHYTESRETALGDKSREGSVVYGVQVRYDYNGGTVPDDGHNDGKDYTFGDSDLIEQGAYWGNAVKLIKPTVQSGSEGVTVTWHEPANLQEVSLFGYPKELELGTYVRPKAEIRGRYSTPNRYNLMVRVFGDRFIGGPQPALYAVRLIPDSLVNVPDDRSNERYTIIIRNGAKRDDRVGGVVGITYEQEFNVPEDWKPGEWVTVVLDKPFVIDPMNDLFIGYGMTNKDHSPGVAYVKNSNDALRPHIDAFLLVNQMQVPFHESKYRGNNAPEDYHAMRFVFAPSADVEKRDDFVCFAQGKVPVPFPKVRSYKLLKNGELVADNLTDTEYKDAKGSATDSYSVEVVYENSSAYAPVAVSEVERSLEPVAYPTQLDATAQLYVENSDKVATLRILTVDGACVLQLDRPSRVIDLSTLSRGQYIVVMQTAEQTFTQYITK